MKSLSLLAALGMGAMATLALAPATALAANDKVGQVGSVSLAHPLVYAIRFENSPTATAPVQSLLIVDPLDATTLDFTTVSLGDITFGAVRVIVPPGLSAFSTTVDLRPARDLLVSIAVGLDPISHALGWHFVSLDPVTGMPPTDPFVGFLLPNDTPPEGEGSVLFTVLPRNTLIDGTTITNHGTISFDGGTPLVTNTWSNVVDAAAPSSHVLPLPATTAAASIPIAWTAEGAPADLRDFTVYVSEDAAAYRVWRLNTTATSDTLVPPGHYAHTYSFYSVARDWNGNVEAAPANPDATTQSLLVVESSAARLALVPRANPITAPMRVQVVLPTGDPARLELLDSSGRRVWSREVGVLGSGRHEIDVDTGVVPGVYFVRLVQGSSVRSARLTVVQ